MTTQSITISSGDAPTPPEFVDAKGANALFGLKRSHLYLLAASGSIRSVSLRRPGTIRGRRLFDCASIRKFLNDNLSN